MDDIAGMQLTMAAKNNKETMIIDAIHLLL